MAGQLPSFLSGSNVEIVIGGVTVAFAKNLSVSRNMSVIPVQSIGSYSTQALEPTMFSANGSLTITRYSSKVLGGGTSGFNRTTNANKRTLPEQMRKAAAQDGSGLRDGNSIIDAVSFNPRKTLISSTFDIEVYERGVDPLTGAHTTVGQNLLYTMKDCRLTNFSFSFAVGSLLEENTTFVCRTIIDGGTSSDIDGTTLDSVTPTKSVY
jgi:hypothetical protein